MSGRGLRSLLGVYNGVVTFPLIVKDVHAVRTVGCSCWFALLPPSPLPRNPSYVFRTLIAAAAAAAAAAVVVAAAAVPVLLATGAAEIFT